MFDHTVDCQTHGTSRARAADIWLQPGTSLKWTGRLKQKKQKFLPEEIGKNSKKITCRYGQHNFSCKISDRYLDFWGSDRTMNFTTVIEAKTGILDPLV